MENTPKPIKRSKELVPLSKEHHEGLLCGWKIKQGLRNGTPHEVIADFTQWFWEADLKEHFRKEEEVLAPHLPKDDVLVQQMLKEHEELKALIRRCAAERAEAVFLQLADGLHNHIRFEERELFPHAEEVISPEAMQSIYHELVKEHPHREWENAFWERK